MKLLHQDVLLSLVKKKKIISLLSFSAYISFQISCLLLGLNWRENKKGRVCEIKVLEQKVWVFLFITNKLSVMIVAFEKMLMG